MDRSYIAENNAERKRLQALVERLREEELSRPMPAGWTVAGVLAHLAFWDGRALSLIRHLGIVRPLPLPIGSRRRSTGSTTPPSISVWRCRRA